MIPIAVHLKSELAIRQVRGGPRLMAGGHALPAVNGCATYGETRQVTARPHGERMRSQLVAALSPVQH